MGKDIKKPLRTSLQRTYISMKEWARTNNIYHIIYPLKIEVWGFVYKSYFNNYLILINQNLSSELQKEVFCHEVGHIMHDMPGRGYIIGLDMQYEKFEKEADEFARLAGNIFF